MRLQHRNEWARTRRGVSLVEVLVVIVVLIIGIFAISRLFPSGFAGLAATGRRSLGRTLARGMEEYFRNRAFNIPDALVGINPVTGADEPYVHPQQLLSEVAYETGEFADPRFSGYNILRRVKGELARVPPPRPIPGGGVGSLYNLVLSPIYSAQAIPGKSIGVQCYSAIPLRPVPVTIPPPNVAANDMVVGIEDVGVDGDNATLYFHSAPTDRSYRVRIGFIQAGGGNQLFWTPPTARLVVPATAAGMNTWAINVRGMWNIPANATISPGAVQLYRELAPVALGDAFNGSDPYQFKVLDTVFGSLVFNPLGATYTQSRSEGRGLLVKIDYDVDDWSIIREDMTVPTGGLPQVQLGIRGVKKVGEAEDTPNLVSAGQADQNYQGLIRNYPATGNDPGRPGSTGIDFVVVDLETGFRMTSARFAAAPATTPGQNGIMDYDDSVITFTGSVTWEHPTDANNTFQAPIAGRHIRVYYRTLDDWTVAVQKPYYQYTYLPTAGALGPGEFGYNPVSFQGYVLFPATDGEQSVTVDYQWTQMDSNGDPARLRTELGEMHVISNPGDANSPQNSPMGFGGPNWWIRLNNHDNGASGAGTPPDLMPGSVTILGVRGASFTTRVAWRESGRWANVRHVSVMTRAEE